MPDYPSYLDASEATWAPEEKIDLGHVTLRRSNGGGKRVTAATASADVTDEEIAVAETRMYDLGQTPLFQIRDGDGDLDNLLAARGYGVVDPTHVYACDIAVLAEMDHDVEQSCLAVWEPLAIQLEFWRDGGIGADRIAVMERAVEPKTALIGRHENSPGGTCFVAVSQGIGVMHALEVIPASRRAGMGRAMTIQAAQWAQKNGASHFCVLCTEANTAANALYTGLGMERAGGYHYRIKES